MCLLHVLPLLLQQADADLQGRAMQQSQMCLHFGPLLMLDRLASLSRHGVILYCWPNPWLWQQWYLQRVDN